MEKIFKETKVDYLTQPLTIEAMKRQMEENDEVTGIIRIELSDAIESGLEWFLDFISEELTGSPLLMDVDYEVLAADIDWIYLKVTGDASNIIEDEE